MEWTTVENLSTREIAEISAEALRGRGFDVQVVGDEAGGLAPHLELGRHSVEVQVPAGQADEARALLADLERESDGGQP